MVQLDWKILDWNFRTFHELKTASNLTGCSLFLIWQVILGVDRLDMIKGIPQKILAFEKFLEENPYWHDKVVLLQIAVPTRTDVPECNLLFSPLDLNY